MKGESQDRLPDASTGQPAAPVHESFTMHALLLNGDERAVDVLATLVLPKVVRQLAVRFPYMDDQLLWDAACDAFLDYSRAPDRFNASCGVPLEVFLSRNAWCNARDLLRTHQRRRAREQLVAQDFFEENVALEYPAANQWEKLMEDSEQLQSSLFADFLHDDKERQILQLWLRGERKSQVFAQLLGLASHLPLIETRKAVKKAKDRIMKKLKKRLMGNGTMPVPKLA